MSKRIITPYGNNNPDIVIPNTTPDGSESLENGYTSAHELPIDGNALVSGLPLQKDVLNQLHKETQTFVKTTQNETAVRWYSAAENGGVLMDYPLAGEVYHNGLLWVSLINNNNTEPGVGADWIAKEPTLAADSLVSPDSGVVLSSDDLPNVVFIPQTFINNSAIELPLSSTVQSGTKIEIIADCAQGVVVFVAPNAANTIRSSKFAGENGGVGAFTNAAAMPMIYGQKITLVCDGENWFHYSERRSIIPSESRTSPAFVSINENGFVTQAATLGFNAVSGAAGQRVTLDYTLETGYNIQGTAQGNLGYIVCAQPVNNVQFDWWLVTRDGGHNARFATGIAMFSIFGRILS